MATTTATITLSSTDLLSDELALLTGFKSSQNGIIALSGASTFGSQVLNHSELSSPNPTQPLGLTINEE